MLNLILAVAAVAYPMTPTGAPVVTIGNTMARTCYESAEARTATAISIAECDSALDGVLSPSDRVATYVNRGILKLIQSDHAAAEADFDTALRLQPDQAEAWLNKGISVYGRGDSRGALALLDKSLQLNTSKAAIAYYARGLANEDSGNIRAAFEDLNRAKALAPKWSAPNVELARYQVRRK
jgi:tetratricopeptide (TPR) repeat protein